MSQEQSHDPYDPEPYPPEENHEIQYQAFQDGFTSQWMLLAQHVAGGGDSRTAPYPGLDLFNPRYPRSAVEGIQQARQDAAAMIDAGAYDAAGILETLAAEEGERRKLRDARALVDQGYFQSPVDFAHTRLHTTVTRVFTDDLVHDAAGMPYEPMHVTAKQLPLDGPVFLLGYGELNLDLSLTGTYRIDVVDAASNEPGSGVLALRFVWGDPSTIVGAVEAGEIRGPNRWVGIGHAGASTLIHEESHRILNSDDPAPLVDDERFGSSAWFWSASAGDGYGIFLAVDADQQAVGLILDSSGITNYYQFGDDDEPVYGPWPDDAREFDPDRDAPPF